MATVEEGIKVEVPVRAAYDQWTQFEELPRFMEGVVEIRQIDATHTRWVVEAAGRRRELEAEMVQMETAPHGAAERAADAGGVVRRRVKGNLQRLKEMIEERGTPTGAWRGGVSQDPTR